MIRTIIGIIIPASLLFSAIAAACVACISEVIGIEETDRRAWDSSEYVLAATVLQAHLNPEPTVDGYYEVLYKVSVNEVFKGHASGVLKIYSTRIVNSWKSELYAISTCGHAVIVPGDTVLVFADSEGEARLGTCTPSRVIFNSNEDRAAIKRLERWRENA
jgi:hypothetical protein